MVAVASNLYGLTPRAIPSQTPQAFQSFVSMIAEAHFRLTQDGALFFLEHSVETRFFLVAVSGYFVFCLDW